MTESLAIVNLFLSERLFHHFLRRQWVSPFSKSYPRSDCVANFHPGSNLPFWEKLGRRHLIIPWVKWIIWTLSDSFWLGNGMKIAMIVLLDDLWLKWDVVVNPFCFWPLWLLIPSAMDQLHDLRMNGLMLCYFLSVGMMTNSAYCSSL